MFTVSGLVAIELCRQYIAQDAGWQRFGATGNMEVRQIMRGSRDQCDRDAADDCESQPDLAHSEHHRRNLQ